MRLSSSLTVVNRGTIMNSINPKLHHDRSDYYIEIF